MATPTRTKSNVLAGYADIWLAPYGTVEPTPDTSTLAEPSTGAGWTGVGYTDQGLTFNIARDISELEVEEEEQPTALVLNRGNVTAEWAYAEEVIENLKYATGGTLTTTAAGVGQIGKKRLALSSTIDQYALCFLGRNPQGFKTRVYIPCVSQFGDVGKEYRRAAKRMTPVSFRALCSFSEIAIVEQTAAAS